ncbi:MAG: glutamate--cysteine ligase [Rhodospirillaceae bacterium]|nr:glutamate--cysteine ligase [Rhodospirillaceae bacterium]
MSAPPKDRGDKITAKRQLVEYLEQGSKPKADWRIGTEHEKFGFRLDDLRPLPYDGPSGIGSLLEGLAAKFGWERIREGENTIALTSGLCNISLEPGGQFELSGAPVETLHETCAEVRSHLAQVKSIGDELGIGMLGMGFQPKWRREDISWMPKGRYKIMGAYMPKKGNLGLDMMTRTCTVQVNLDFASEADMVKKFRVGIALQPIATALFADSPFVEGKPSGFMSYRGHVWTDTDPDRCGMLPFVFDEGMGFERYVDWVLDVPMYFVFRDGHYIDASGQSFRDFLAGRLPALPGELPDMGDWTDHMTTVFSEVRLKRFLEMRGADGGPWDRLCALPAFWTGLLYDGASLDAAWALCKDWSSDEREKLRADVTRDALQATFRGRRVAEWAKDALAIARQGLKARAMLKHGEDETHFLGGLDTIADSGQSPARVKLQRYETEWNGSVDPVFREFAY